MTMASIGPGIDHVRNEGTFEIDSRRRAGPCPERREGLGIRQLSR